MADERLRALRRRATSDPDARERWIRERHRSGQLDAARVRLAAFLGDPLALDLEGSAPAAPGVLLDWAQLLTGFGRSTRAVFVVT